MFEKIGNSDLDSLLKPLAIFPKCPGGIGEIHGRSKYNSAKQFTITTRRLIEVYETSYPGVKYKQGAKETTISFRLPSCQLKWKTSMVIPGKDFTRQIDRNHLKPLVSEYQARRLS